MFVGTPIFEIDFPTRAEDLAKRHHNRFAKEAVREMMGLHFRRHIRKHFQPGNAQRYGHMPRNREYEESKRRRTGRIIDLVGARRRKPRSRDQIVRSTPQIRVGGSAEGGQKGITGRYSLFFNFSGGTGRMRRGNRRSGVTPQVMTSEVSRWAPDELREASANLMNFYQRRVNAFRGARKRVRMPRRGR